MTDARSTPGLVFYPESDGQPMTESDATRDYLIYCVEVLRLYFQSRRQVYVSGNLFIYYQEGNPQAVVSPDVFVIFGVNNRQRRSYKTWQEGGKLPAFILEVTSFSTRKQDEVEKPSLYARLGVQEYFQYDPTADYLNPQLKGRCLREGQYEPLAVEYTADQTPFIHSAVLGLDLQLQTPVQQGLGVAPLPKELRFYDPQTGMKLLSRQEVEQARDLAQQERDLAQQERDLAQQERDLAQQERNLAQQERDLAQQRAEQLAARLRELGLDPDQG
ncbi:MAG: Uma2 family endonuclease [Elainellaceae cyanobacterium]